MQIKKAFIFIFLLIPLLLHAQISNDSVNISKYPETTEGINFSPTQLIAPAALIGLGVFGLVNNSLDKKINENVEKHNLSTPIDDILPFIAPASVYVLNWCNVPGKHNFIDRSVILGTATILALTPVEILKYSVSRERPDESSNLSFPSGHTTIAFIGAEFAYQEYKDQSIWYGVAGYGFAAATGVLRVYNNSHWLSDVLAGAGFGILGTKAAYWLYPEIRKLYQGTKFDHAVIVPYVSGNSYGISLSAKF